MTPLLKTLAGDWFEQFNESAWTLKHNFPLLRLGRESVQWQSFPRVPLPPLAELLPRRTGAGSCRHQSQTWKKINYLRSVCCFEKSP